MSQLLGLLAFIVLCAGWAVFQVWLSRHDPEANQCLRNCGSCKCDNSTTANPSR
jgi:hypothetical protein